jgi:DNA-binding transcriptional MerR regulator
MVGLPCFTQNVMYDILETNIFVHGGHMHKDGLFTTGEVAGLLYISAATIQRYIKTFPESFSEGARKPSRGRRYNSDDVRKLYTIHHLYNQRFRESSIRQALSRGVLAPVGEKFQVEDALEIVETARGQFAGAEYFARQARSAAQTAKSSVDTVSHELGRYKDLIDRLEGRIRKIENELRIKPHRNPPNPW